MRSYSPIARLGEGIATGVVATEEQEPRRWAMVRGVAQRVGTPSPKNILLGLEPNFYAAEQAKELLGPVDERSMAEKRRMIVNHEAIEGSARKKR
ncbi:MAG TPA: hypothetical protein VFX49_08345 [Chloroflexota bacterium]|nr:hypothetical protein [Chloroflexota bacterium]